MTEQESDAVNPKGTPDNEFAAVEPSDQSEFATGERLGGERYRSSDQTPTGFWKQSLDTAKEDMAYVWLQQGVLTLDPLANPLEDMTDLPTDRASFVKQAITLTNVGNETAHRFWMFVNGMKLGDKVFVHGHKNRSLLVGVVDGTYSHVEAGDQFNHRRSMKWWDVSRQSNSDDLHTQNAFSSSLWGLTVMLPQHFDAVMNALGLASDDVDGWDRITSDPASEAVNPGQALYDALSDEAKAAVDALPDDVFAGVGGGDAVNRFIESIRLAHSINPNGWLLSPDSRTGGRDILSLIVSSTRLIHVWQHRFLAVRYDDNVLDESSRAWIDDTHLKTEAVLKTWPNLLRVYIPFPNVAEAPAGLWTAHEAAARALNHPDWEYRRASGGDGWHKDAWRIKLALISGKALPIPTYLPVDRYGLALAGDQEQTSGSNGSEHGPLAGAKSKNEAITGPSNGIFSIVSAGMATAGLTYRDDQIASFYTSLQTKGFVILSGISGTGKSKIAQRFANMLPEIRVEVPGKLVENHVRLKQFPYMKKKGYIYLRRSIADQLPVPDESDGYTVDMTVDGEQGTARIATREAPTRGTSITPHGALRDAIKAIDVPSFDLYVKGTDDGTRIKRVAIETDAIDRSDETTDFVANHLFLPVRPDWRDGKALIGYHNPLTGDYVRTDFLEFVIAAGDDYRLGNRNAFFVILDEMNLAHVEYYFADVLSVIESGRDEDGWTVEGIPLAVGDEVEADLPEVLKLPPNLYIVGTVNMDETTHPFSPKVLDRAFTIELTDVDFRDYPPDPVENAANLSEHERRALLDTFTGGGERYPRINKGEIRETVETHEQFRTDLENLNTSLKRYRMHFGYRVFDEIMQFVHNADRNGMFASAENAFDHAVLMKVLPKFNGARGKLEPALLELIHWCRSSSTFSDEVRQALEAQLGALSSDRKGLDTIVTDTDVAEDRWRYPETGKRAALMMQDLYTDGFASFG